MTEAEFAAFFILLVGSLGDALTTLRGLADGRREINPVMAALFSVMPPKLALVLTKGILAAVALIALLRYDGWYVAAGVALVGVVQGIAAAWNETR